MPRKSAVVGYIRVSSDEQAKSGLSLENQEKKILAQAELQDLKIDRIIRDEGKSAKTMARPGMESLLAGVRNGKVSHIIIFKLDRLTRSLRDLLDLLDLFKKHGVSLLSLSETLDTSSAAGELIVHILGAVAEWERGTISERTQVALDVKRQKGEKLGGKRPYGFRVKQGKPKKLVPDPKEQLVRNDILRIRKLGHGYQDIAEALNEKKVKPRDGRRWYASTIRAICLRAGLSPKKGGAER